MKIQKLFCCFIFLFISISRNLAQNIEDSLNYRNCIKIDFSPLYEVFFDSHKQLRIGLEYDRNISKHFFSEVYLDFGLYDNYYFYKYNNFFNENGGISFNKSDVTVKGFHLLPSYNYNLFTEKMDKLILFSGIGTDISFYWKDVNSINSLNNTEDLLNYSQTKLGVGISIGARLFFSRHFLLEIKSSFYSRLYDYINSKNGSSIYSYDAQWNSSNTKFWSISNLKLGYVF